MKHAAVLLLVACALFSTGSASPCGDVLCPLDLNPICSQDVNGTWNLFNNECELDSCGGVSAFSGSCYVVDVDDASNCAC